MTSEEFYENKCQQIIKKYQIEIEELKKEIAGLNEFVSVVRDNREYLFGMFTKAIQHLAYEKQQLMECSSDTDDGLQAIETQDTLIQNYYSTYSDIDEKFYKLTGDYLI